MLDPRTKILIDLLAEGRESDAYQYLHNEFHATLLDFASAYLKVREPAEEIVNDVLYKVLRMHDEVAAIANLRAYLFTAVRNACLNQLARVRREQEVLSGMPQPASMSADPESQVISMELYDCIRNTIQALPPRCREIYEMVRMEGLRNKDVAARLNISVNTVDVQLAIALKRLVQAVKLFNEGRHIPRKI
ncbi:RNA polymerase sigma-70 factor [Chitinophaga lutea]